MVSGEAPRTTSTYTPTPKRVTGKFDIHITIEADSIAEAINKILYPDGVPIEGVSSIWAEEATA